MHFLLLQNMYVWYIFYDQITLCRTLKIIWCDKNKSLHQYSYDNYILHLLFQDLHDLIFAIVCQGWYFLIFIFQPAYHAIEKNRPSRTSQSHRNSNKSPRFLDSQPSEWTNIIPQIPQRKDQNPNDYTMIGTSFSYTGNFVFYGLTPSTQYEVIIQSRNREGWSDATDIFRFNTRSQGKLRV